MSYEEQETQDGADGTENADDLTMALAGGETTFVSETKQPLSKGTMVVAGLLVACAAVTYFMYVRNGPAEAVANPEQAQAEQVVGQFLKDPNQAKGWAGLIESTDKVVKQFKQDIPQVLLADLAGNPFQKGKPKDNVDTLALRAKEELERQKAAAKEAVAELKLSTIFHRDPKKATVIINQKMYRKGDKIPALEGKVTFIVDSISPDTVTVSFPVKGEEPLKFELKMKR